MENGSCCAWGSFSRPFRSDGLPGAMLPGRLAAWPGCLAARLQACMPVSPHRCESASSRRVPAVLHPIASASPAILLRVHPCEPAWSGWACMHTLHTCVSALPCSACLPRPGLPLLPALPFGPGPAPPLGGYPCGSASPEKADTTCATSSMRIKDSTPTPTTETPV